MASRSIVYLIPTVLHEGLLEPIPAYVSDAVRAAEVFFVEEERTARRYLKKLLPDFVIDNVQWFGIHKAEDQLAETFTRSLKENKIVAILSEAGCPGVADPGQQLVAIAQALGARVVPLVGPNSLLLALMASGMNGQQFRFLGYLPIEAAARQKAIRELEADSAKTTATQLFIETPYRNNQLIEALLNTCKPHTRLCIAVDITGPDESIRTKTIGEWKNSVPDIHKKPAVFLLQS